MKKIVKKGIVLSILISILWVTQVMAYSFNMVAKPNTTTIKPGEAITITLGIENIDAGEVGINTVETQLLYDSDVFEKVTQDEIKSTNNWALTYNGENNGGKILGVILASGIKENQDSIGTVTLKAKKEITKKETSIKFSNITTNEGTTLITDKDKEIKLQIKQNSGNQEETPTNTSEETNEKTEKTTIPTQSTDKTTATKIIPAAGIGGLFIGVIIVILIVNAISSKRQINKMK